MIHGTNPAAPILMSVLGLDGDFPMREAPYKGEYHDDYDEAEMQKWVDEAVNAGYFPTGRFRDIFLNEDGTQISLYTRNGGGNRDNYTHVFRVLRKHPQYTNDYDDDYDCTYATIDFKVPEKFKAACQAMATGEKLKTIGEKFQDSLKELENMSKEEMEKRYAPLVGILKQIEEKTKSE